MWPALCARSASTNIHRWTQPPCVNAPPCVVCFERVALADIPKKMAFDEVERVKTSHQEGT